MGERSFVHGSEPLATACSPAPSSRRRRACAEAAGAFPMVRRTHGVVALQTELTGHTHSSLSGADTFSSWPTAARTQHQQQGL